MPLRRSALHSAAKAPERISASTRSMRGRTSRSRKRSARVIEPYWLVCEWWSIWSTMPSLTMRPSV